MIIDDFFTWLGCKIFKHKYYVMEEFSKNERKVGCHICDKMWAMHDGVKSFLLWDREFEDLYYELPEMLEWAERRKKNKEIK